jgi:hypothetical protein
MRFQNREIYYNYAILFYFEMAALVNKSTKDLTDFLKKMIAKGQLFINDSRYFNNGSSPIINFIIDENSLTNKDYFEQEKEFIQQNDYICYKCIFEKENIYIDDATCPLISFNIFTSEDEHEEYKDLITVMDIRDSPQLIILQLRQDCNEDESLIDFLDELYPFSPKPAKS